MAILRMLPQVSRDRAPILLGLHPVAGGPNLELQQQVLHLQVPNLFTTINNLPSIPMRRLCSMPQTSHFSTHQKR